MVQQEPNLNRAISCFLYDFKAFMKPQKCSYCWNFFITFLNNFSALNTIKFPSPEAIQPQHAFLCARHTSSFLECTRASVQFQCDRWVYWQSQSFKDEKHQQWCRIYGPLYRPIERMYPRSCIHPGKGNAFTCFRPETTLKVLLGLQSTFKLRNILKTHEVSKLLPPWNWCCIYNRFNVANPTVAGATLKLNSTTAWRKVFKDRSSHFALIYLRSADIIRFVKNEGLLWKRLWIKWSNFRIR
jgi:hypothetical protein